MGWLLLVLAGLVYLALGPWGVLGLLALLGVPRIRAWVLTRLPRARRPWRATGLGALALGVVTGGLLLVPAGWLPVPSAGGLLATPSYEGRQVSARPLAAAPPPAHPWLAPPGRTSSHTDAWNTHATTGPGPLGDDPQVYTAWAPRERCGDLAWDSHGRLVALCRNGAESELRVIDPDTLRPLVTKRLPTSEGCGGPGEARPDFFLDHGDRAVVTTGGRRVQALSTSDAAGEPDLSVVGSWNLTDLTDEDDCLVAALPDWAGRVWWATRDGRVGVLDPVDGGARVIDVRETISNTLAVDEGAVYLVTDDSVQRLGVDERGVPAVVWRTPYDRGVERKSGQRRQASGSGPTLLDGGLLAFTDNAEPRLHVVLLDRETGHEVCRSAVFPGGESASEASLVSVGTGVVVTNTHGYDGPRDTQLGFAPTAGMARVDHEAGECTVRWSNDEVVVPASTPKASWGTGLVYAWTKRPTLWGVGSWHLTAVDAESGRAAFSVRAGTGGWFSSRGSDLLLAPDGSVLVGTSGGLVRIRDRVRGS